MLLWLLPLIQVSTKESELGIGQLVFQPHRYKVVNYLPFMFESDLIVQSARPKPIVSYDSIVYPFDTYVWIFTFACIMAQFFLLQIMQSVWCKVSGTSNQIDFIYEGIPKHGKE